MNEKEKNNQESIKNIAKLSTLDKEILTIAKNNPNYNNHQIGKELVTDNKSQHPKSIYSRLTYSDLLRSEIDKVRTHNHEYLAREIIPEALKIHKKVLKDKSINPKDKDTWVSMAYRAGLKTEPTAQAAKTITIGQINVLQQMGRDDCEVVEGEVIDE